MICPICKTDITENIKQFGRIGNTPICQSCWLSDDEWTEDDPQILQYLADGMSLADAMKQVNSEHCRTIEDELKELLQE